MAPSRQKNRWPEAYCAAREDRRADIMADGVAAQPGHRRDPVRHVVAADRAQCEQVVERQRQVRAANTQRGEAELSVGLLADRGEDNGGVDALQRPHERRDSQRDDDKAGDDAEALPADPPLEAAPKHA